MWRKKKPDIAHLHNIYHQLSPSILYVLNRLDIPTIMTLHDYKLICPSIDMIWNDAPCEKCLGGGYIHALRRRCFKGSFLTTALSVAEAALHRTTRIYHRAVNIFISPSRFLKDLHASGGFDTHKIEVLPNFIRIGKIEPSYSGNGCGLFLGKVIKIKGVFTLVAAMERLPEACMAIAGRGESLQEITEIIQKKKIENVYLEGFVSGNPLLRLTGGTSYVVLPSEWYENNPIVILEAFAHGKPVIGSRIGGIPELIEDGKNGFLFTPGDADELAEKVKYLSDHPEEAAEMGRRARATVEREYSAQVHYRKLMRIYERAIDMRRGAKN